MSADYEAKFITLEAGQWVRFKLDDETKTRLPFRALEVLPGMLRADVPLALALLDPTKIADWNPNLTVTRIIVNGKDELLLPAPASVIGNIGSDLPVVISSLEIVAKAEKKLEHVFCHVGILTRDFRSTGRLLMPERCEGHGADETEREVP